jgi:hypothetical protein
MVRHAEQALTGGPRGVARRGIALVALLAALMSGCTSSGQLVPDLGPGPAPVVQLIPVWNNHVLTGVDPTHNGAPMCGLGGRIYLCGPDMRYVMADGKLVVELWAVPPEQPQGPAVRMEWWEIKKEILNQACLHTDAFGQGYTLNLPWPSYRPDISHVQMRVRYESGKGLPVFGQSLVALDRDAGPTIAGSRTLETGDRRPVVAAQPAAPSSQTGAVQQAGAWQPQAPSQPASGFQPPPMNGMQPASGFQPQAPSQPTGGFQPPPQAQAPLQPAGESQPQAQAPWQPTGGSQPPPMPQYPPAGGLPQQSGQAFPGAYQR